MEDKFIKILSMSIFVLGFLLLLANFAREHFTQQKNKKEKAKNAMSGEIKSMSQNTGEVNEYNYRFAEENLKDLIILKIGGATCAYDKKLFHEGLETTRCVTVNDTEPVKIKFVDGRLFVSTKIFDLDGKIVCEIIDNEWSLNSNNYYKRNYDSHAVEVIDQFDNVVLSAEMINQQTILVNGIINIKGGGIMFAYGDHLAMLASSTESKKIIEAMEKRPWEEIYNEHAKKVPRLFSYGNDALGKRINSSD